MSLHVDSWQVREWVMKFRWVVPRSVRRRALLGSPLLSRLVKYESVMDATGLREARELLDMTLGVEGDIVECGCNRCGTSVIMANHLASRGAKKIIYACDTFDGFSPDELVKEKELGRTGVSQAAFAAPTQFEYVKEKLVRLGLGGRVVAVKGFFQDTFPLWVEQWKTLSFVLVDCDLEDSMLFCARTLWPFLAPGGVMAFDDYTSEQFKGARVAVDRFVAEEPSGIGSHQLMKRFYYVQKGK